MRAMDLVSEVMLMPLFQLTLSSTVMQLAATWASGSFASISCKTPNMPALAQISIEAWV